MSGNSLLTLPLPDAPYRGLEPYRYCDQAVFFERELEAERTMRLLTMFRGSLLYGESGAGKSSLVNAGVIPKAAASGMTVDRLRVQPRRGAEFVIERILVERRTNTYLPSVFVERGDNRRAVFAASTLRDRLKNACRAEALLIFDQFEELITLASDTAAGSDASDTQGATLEAIVALLHDRKLTNIRILFVFREDYLAKLERLFYFCPELPDQFLRLTPPPTTSLRKVIRGPFETEALPRDYWQHSLPPEIMDRLERLLSPADETAINLSRVQVASLQLWRSPDAASALHRGVKGLISDHLNGELNRLGKNREVAESLLALMITKQGTRKVVVENELLDEASNNKKKKRQLSQTVVAALVDEARLVRRDYNRDTTTYEIVSEFIVPWIRQLKLRREQSKFRQFVVRRGLAFVVIVMIGAGAFFYQQYSRLTFQAVQARLVQDAQARAAAAESEREQTLRIIQESGSTREKALVAQMETVRAQAIRSDDLAKRTQSELDTTRARAEQAEKSSNENRMKIQELNTENQRLRTEVETLKRIAAALPQPVPGPPNAPSQGRPLLPSDVFAQQASPAQTGQQVLPQQPVMAEQGVPAARGDTQQTRPSADTTQGPAVSAMNLADEQSIQQLLREYTTAYEQMNVDAILQIHPTLQRRQLEDVFAQYRSYGMNVGNVTISTSGNTAVVTCTIVTNIRPRVGDAQSFTRATTLRLEKRGTSWVIVDRR